MTLRACIICHRLNRRAPNPKEDVMLKTIRDQWEFDTKQGWTLRTKIYNAAWLALNPLPYRIAEPIRETMVRLFITR